MKLRFALVTPPLAGHSIRGTGVYAQNLLEGFQEYIQDAVMEKVTITDNLESYDAVIYPYFDPFFLTLPLIKKIPAVVTIHDLIPLSFPSGFKPGLRGKIKWYLQKFSLKNVTAVITDSESSKRDIEKYASVSADKIKVIYLGIGREFVKIPEKKLSPLRKRMKLPDNFILHVGDVNYNKNIDGLIRAFSLVREKNTSLNLILVGKGFTDKSEELDRLKSLINQLNLELFIHFPGRISSDELVAMYNLATVYVQPSYAEGFGLPVLEAMSCGCPVVSSVNSSLAEITDDAAISVDPQNIASIAEGITGIISNNVTKNNLVKKGFINAGKYSWEKCIRNTFNVLKSAVQEK